MLLLLLREKSPSPVWDSFCQEICSSVGSSLNRSSGAWQESFPSQASQWFTASFGNPTAPARVSSMGCRATAASPWPSPQVSQDSYLQDPEHLLSLLLHWPWGLQSCSSHICTICSALTTIKNCTISFLHLKYVIQRCCYHSWLD